MVSAGRELNAIQRVHFLRILITRNICVTHEIKKNIHKMTWAFHKLNVKFWKLTKKGLKNNYKTNMSIIIFFWDHLLTLLCFSSKEVIFKSNVLLMPSYEDIDSNYFSLIDPSLVVLKVAWPVEAKNYFYLTSCMS